MHEFYIKDNYMWMGIISGPEYKDYENNHGYLESYIMWILPNGKY